MVQPEEEQIHKIRELVGAHEPIFRENFMRHRQEMDVLVDSLHQDLEPILTEKQRERVIRIRRRSERRRELRRRELRREGSQEYRRERNNRRAKY